MVFNCKPPRNLHPSFFHVLALLLPDEWNSRPQHEKDEVIELLMDQICDRFDFPSAVVSTMSNGVPPGIVIAGRDPEGRPFIHNGEVTYGVDVNGACLLNADSIDMDFINNRLRAYRDQKAA